MKHSTMRHVCLTIGLLILVMARSAYSEWEPIGLDGITVFALAFRPGDSDTVYAGTDDGVYRSIDGAETWALVGAIQDARRIAVDPVEKDYVYAAGSQGVYRSADGGDTWLEKDTGIEFEPWLTLNDIAINTCHPETLYLSGTYDQASGILYRSANRAESWSQQPTPWDPNGVAGVAIDPIRCGRMFSGENWTGPVGRSFDSGITWQSTSLQDVPNDFAINPHDPDIVYVVGDGSDGRFLYRSDDGGGKSWTRLGPEYGITRLVEVVAVNPVNPTFVYVAGDTLFRSADGGITWAAFSDGLPGGTDRVKSIAVEGEFGETVLVGVEDRGIFRHSETIAGTEPQHLETDNHPVGLRASPNPFRTQTEISCSVSRTAHTILAVHDVTGRLVRTLVAGRTDAGRHVVRWDGRNDDGARVSPGIYILRMKAEGFSEQRKIVIAK